MTANQTTATQCLTKKREEWLSTVSQVPLTSPKHQLRLRETSNLGAIDLRVPEIQTII